MPINPPKKISHITKMKNVANLITFEWLEKWYWTYITNVFRLPSFKYMQNVHVAHNR